MRRALFCFHVSPRDVLLSVIINWNKQTSFQVLEDDVRLQKTNLLILSLPRPRRRRRRRGSSDVFSSSISSGELLLHRRVVMSSVRSCDGGSCLTNSNRPGGGAWRRIRSDVSHRGVRQDGHREALVSPPISLPSHASRQQTKE